MAVIVPAHNEERGIEDTLRSIVSQLHVTDQIVVVCNGCTDDTAHVARTTFGDRVMVAELEEPSKIAALNHGDGMVTAFPRLYIDSDVVLSPGSIDAIAHALASGDVDVASPRLLIDTRGATRSVRLYMRIWSQLPSVRDDTVGRGVYALSRTARASFTRFPDITGDDHFVRDLVPSHRRVVVDGAQSTVAASGNLRGLLRRKPRTVAGNRELDQAGPEGRDRSTRRGRQWLTVVRNDLSLLPAVPVYVLVNAHARLVTRLRQLTGRSAGWDRDDSSRSTPSLAGRPR
ncbi:glycosyltransferase [Euzebya tangerina]|uniref:glycosyltransferase n=1 Tax=Euzebya tangerina TaxID=591198 RepID=UPI0013C2A7F1|nr:glycosyltransferase [Euzebya tangerina]